jgi:hypothetical protein
MKETTAVYYGIGLGETASAYAVPQVEVTPMYAIQQPDENGWGRLLESLRGSTTANEMRAILECLVRVEEKLDELLRRTAPEASVVDEIRRRVNEALDAVKGKGKQHE